MDQEPQELRHDIAHAREGAQATIGRIEERVSPRRIGGRGTARLRGAWGGARDRVMGSPQVMRINETGSAQGGSRLEDVTGDISARVDQLEEKGRRHYQGNPLAVGLVAFGAGALIGSLLPDTQPERKISGDLKQRLAPVGQELKQAGQEVAQDLRQEAQTKIEDVKGTASEAAEAVKEDARDAAEELRDESAGRAENVGDAARA
ncbi:MAG TPA: hypothetical protein VM324_11360 [Egibacteraceae bacterium]|jgi:gas vesicle protein|nr:hypothetical protein [Egibacteraceae bacterium]